MDTRRKPKVRPAFRRLDAAANDISPKDLSDCEVVAVVDVSFTAFAGFSSSSACLIIAAPGTGISLLISCIRQELSKRTGRRISAHLLAVSPL